MGNPLRSMATAALALCACAAPPPPAPAPVDPRPPLPLPPAGFIPDSRGGELERAYVSTGREFQLWIGYTAEGEPLERIVARHARTDLARFVRCSATQTVQYPAGEAKGATCTHLLHGPYHQHVRVVGNGPVNVVITCTAPDSEDGQRACAEMIERFHFTADPPPETTGKKVGQAGWFVDLPAGWEQIRSEGRDSVRWAQPTLQQSLSVRNLGPDEDASVVVEAAGSAAARRFDRLDPVVDTPWRGHPSWKLTGLAGRPHPGKREVLAVARRGTPIALVCVETATREGCEGILSALEWR